LGQNAEGIGARYCPNFAGAHYHLGGGSAKRSRIEAISLVFMAFAAKIFAFRALASDAVLLDALEFLSLLEELAREAGFVAAETLKAWDCSIQVRVWATRTSTRSSWGRVGGLTRS
jgi:hypothetical protein